MERSVDAKQKREGWIQDTLAVAGVVAIMAGTWLLLGWGGVLVVGGAALVGMTMLAARR